MTAKPTGATTATPHARLRLPKGSPSRRDLPAGAVSGMFSDLEYYRLLFEAVPVGISITTPSGEVLAFNERLSQITGVSAREARRMAASDFYANPADRRSMLRQLQRQGTVEGKDILLKRKDGNLVLCRSELRHAHLNGRKVILSVVQDITAQRKAERHLAGVAELLKLFTAKRSQQEYLDSAVGLLQHWCGCHCVGIRLLDGKGGLPYAAQRGFARRFVRQACDCPGVPGGCACLHVARCSRPGRSREGFSEVFFLNDTAGLVRHLRNMPVGCGRIAALREGHQSVAQTPILYHGRFIGTIHLADRRPNRFGPETISFIRSVAPLLGEAIHRADVESSLHESEVRFRSLFERHNAVMLLIEPVTGAIVDANPAAARFYGFGQDQLRRLNISNLNMLPRESVAAARRRALREHTKLFVFPHRLANGEVKTVEVHSSPVQVEGRTLLFSIIHDITDRKRLEQQVLDISEKERQRVGRDLHDSLGGKLTGAALIAKALAQRLRSGAAAEAALAEEVVQSINESIAQTRAIARGLCPVELTMSGLGAALLEFAGETSRRTGIPCSARIRCPMALRDPLVNSHLFRISQEAVTNAIKHGHASRVWIDLEQTVRHLTLRIRNNGKAFSQSGGQSGLGLSTMQYRADLIGAQLTIRRLSKRGTLVQCRLPLPLIIRGHLHPTK